MTIPPNTASYIVVCGQSYGHGTYNNDNSYGYGGAGYRKGGNSGANGGGLSGIFTGTSKLTFDDDGQKRGVAIAGGGGGGGYISGKTCWGGSGGGSKGSDGMGHAEGGCRASGGSQIAEWAHENGNHGGVVAKSMRGGVTSTDGNTGAGGGGYYGGATQSCAHNAGGGGGSGYVGGSGDHKFAGTMENGAMGAGNGATHYPGGTSDPLWSVNWPIGRTNREGNVVITF